MRVWETHTGQGEVEGLENTKKDINCKNCAKMETNQTHCEQDTSTAVIPTKTSSNVALGYNKAWLMKWNYHFRR